MLLVAAAPRGLGWGWGGEMEGRNAVCLWTGKKGHPRLRFGPVVVWVHAKGQSKGAAGMSRSMCAPLFMPFQERGLAIEEAALAPARGHAMGSRHWRIQGFSSPRPWALAPFPISLSLPRTTLHRRHTLSRTSPPQARTRGRPRARTEDTHTHPRSEEGIWFLNLGLWASCPPPPGTCMHPPRDPVGQAAHPAVLLPLGRQWLSFPSPGRPPAPQTFLGAARERRNANTPQPTSTQPNPLMFHAPTHSPTPSIYIHTESRELWRRQRPQAQPRAARWRPRQAEEEEEEEEEGMQS